MRDEVYIRVGPHTMLKLSKEEYDSLQPRSWVGELFAWIWRLFTRR